MSDNHSVSELIQRLDQEDSKALSEIWNRYIHRLITESRRQLMNFPRRAADEEDVAQEAFQAFFDGMKEGRFVQLENRDDLWKILVLLAERKAVTAIRRETASKRGGLSKRGESVFERWASDASAAFGINEIVGPSPTMIDGFSTGVRELLEQLPDDTMKSIAMMRLGGYSNQEIAKSLQIAKRTVERKLGLIRKAWNAIDL
ncbi:MAG: ECF-type sigma factor [Planctomycetota bacterium]